MDVDIIFKELLGFEPYDNEMEDLMYILNAGIDDLGVDCMSKRMHESLKNFIHKITGE